jgi:Ion channel
LREPDYSFYRYEVVLVMLTGAFTFAMVAPAVPWARVVNAALVSGAVFAALNRARAGRRLLRIGLVVIALALATAIASAFGGRFEGGASDLLAAGLLSLVPVAITLEFRRNLTVTIQSVAAALCVYVVLGMFFASVASAVGNVSGSPYFADRPKADSADYTYFSFVTLATVGYGDFVPALRLGRALAVLEGLSGQLYLVTVVALVVGGFARRRQDRSRP